MQRSFSFEKLLSVCRKNFFGRLTEVKGVPKTSKPKASAYQGDSQQEVFVENFGSDQMAMYRAIVDTTKEKVVPRDDIAAIIPSGTAIQNARTSYFGDILTEDTYHLSDLGKVIAGYTLYAVLADKPLEAINFTQVTNAFALSDSNKEVIIDAVNNAVKTPFEVTQSAYPD